MIKYSGRQRQLLVDSFISLIKEEDFWKLLGAGQKTNALESINFHCRSKDFRAKNEKNVEDAIARKEEEPGIQYEYQFEFEWHIPGTGRLATISKTFPSVQFEACF